jgi:hypothetical protein
MKTMLLIGCVLLTSTLGLGTKASAAGNAPGEGIQTSNAIAQQRADLAEKIILRWGAYVQESYRADVKTWAREMLPMFKVARMNNLQEAARARSFDAMNDALLGNKTTLSAGKGDPSTQALGDSTTDLVFVPVTPCRVFDTRLAGGVITNGSVRNFDITAVGNYSFQGGDATNCGGVGAAGSFAAAVINFTVVSTSTTGGFITAYPYLATRPNASNLNWEPGTNIVRGNLATVRLDQGASADELSVYVAADGGAHLIGDIVGYYHNPPTLVLDCVQTANSSLSVAAGGTDNVVAPACAAGYTPTATNCESSTWDMPFVFSSGGTCSAKNLGASSATLRASRTCCRIPTP